MDALAGLGLGLRFRVGVGVGVRVGGVRDGVSTVGVRVVSGGFTGGDDVGLRIHGWLAGSDGELCGEGAEG